VVILELIRATESRPETEGTFLLDQNQSLKLVETATFELIPATVPHASHGDMLAHLPISTETRQKFIGATHVSNRTRRQK
jgi:hypothetical protein